MLQFIFETTHAERKINISVLCCFDNPKDSYSSGVEEDPIRL